MSLSCRSPRARRFRGADFSVLAVEVTEEIDHCVMAVTLPERVACDDPPPFSALHWVHSGLGTFCASDLDDHTA